MSNTALLVIDVQTCMFDPVEPVYNSTALLPRLQSLLDRARTSNTPVIYVQHCGPAGAPHAPGAPGWAIHPAIAPLPGELVVQKTTPDSFHQTPLNEELTARGIEQLVIVGIQTDYCVDTTCRHAVSEGYTVTLVSDAHSTWGDGGLSAQQIIDHHNRVLGNWFAQLATTDTVHFGGAE